MTDCVGTLKCGKKIKGTMFDLGCHKFTDGDYYVTCWRFHKKNVYSEVVKAIDKSDHPALVRFNNDLALLKNVFQIVSVDVIR